MAQQSPLSLLYPLGANDDDDGGISLPYQRSFQGPWFSQQVTLSLAIGILSLIAFTLLRRKNTALFAPRTKLKGFSPLDDAGFDAGYFGWIWSTIKTDEMRILHTVGLDAAVLLAFLKMGFWLFSIISIWCCLVLMPVNYWQNGVLDGVSPAEDQRNGTHTSPTLSSLPRYSISNHSHATHPPPLPQLPLPAPQPHAIAYHFTHLLSVYAFTLLALRAIWKNYHTFVRSRQLYILEILESIPARTVEIRDLPLHLRDDRDLAEYFEAMDMRVESTAVVRKVGGLSKLLTAREKALHKLENTWVQWLGNPTDAEGYDPDKIMLLAAAYHEHGPDELLEQSSLQGTAREPQTGQRAATDTESSVLLPQRQPGSRPRPRSTLNISGADTIRTKKMRPRMRRNPWNPFSDKIDALDELTRRYNELDRAVRERRRAGRFAGSKVGFVTFEDAASAQIASQTVHYPTPARCRTSMAPEPRDIIWSNVDLSNLDRRVRQVIVSVCMILLLVFYIPPLVFLASFLSPGAIKRYLPWLDRLLGTDERLRALVQNNLPSLVLIGFNNLLPLILEWSAVAQGIKTRSLVEYSVLKKYYLFLMVSVVFIFLITTTAWGVLQELAANPARLIDKLAASLPGARFFSLSYVIITGIALQPLQLLQLPTLILRGFYRVFLTRTPREFAELNAPPTLVMGTIYPQALLIFTLCILYSIVSPLICIFGAVYFGLTYVVTKYKLLYVFYKPYESQGQAWPISASRCIWALVLFHVFEFSVFSVRKQLLASVLVVPLLIFTIWFNHHLSLTFGPLTHHVNLSSLIEVTKDLQRSGKTSDAFSQMAQAGPPAAAVADELLGRSGDAETSSPSAKAAAAANKVAKDSHRALLALDPEHAVERRHTDLARKRLEPEDDTLFVAQRDAKTDYREPPGSGYYPGVLNTGRRRYGHPAITGILPDLWLPIPIEATSAEEQQDATASAATSSGTTARGSTDDLESGLAAATASSHRSLASAAAAVKARERALSKAEPLILSLRRRKSSLLSSMSSSTVGAGAGDGRTGTRRRTPNSTRPPPPTEDLVGIWSDGVSGPQGSSSQAAVGEVLAGDRAVAPARTRLSSLRYGAAHQGQHGGVAEEANMGEEGEPEENRAEEEEEDDDEGVYMHRAARRGSASYRD